MGYRRLVHGVVLAAVAVSTLVAVSSTTATATVGEGGSFVPLNPALLADTRTGVGVPEGSVGADGVRTIQVAGRGGVPTSNVSAVLLDLGAESTANTTLSVYPANAERKYGNLTVAASEQRAANTAIVRLGSGKIKVHNSAGATDFSVGVQGYFTETTTEGSAGGFVPIEPQRVVRTDHGVGIKASPLEGGSVYTAQIGGVGAIPADATSVFANVRVRDAAGATSSNTGRGGLRIGASNTTISQSTTSVLDYAKGPDADSGLALKLGPDGKIKLTISTNTTADLVIDVQGYFTAGAEGGAFTPLDNRRFYDSRDAEGPLAAGESREIKVEGLAGMPVGQTGAVALHLSGMDNTGTGTLAIYNPDNDFEANGTSNVGFKAAYDATSRQSTAIIGVSFDGTIVVKNQASSGSVQVLLNAQGWFTVAETPLPSEADTVSETMRSAMTAPASTDQEEVIPAFTAYEARPLTFSEASATKAVTFPLPSGCSQISGAPTELQCSYGKITVSGKAVTADGQEVSASTSVQGQALVVEPTGATFDGIVTAYVSASADADLQLADTAAETLAEFVAVDEDGYRAEPEIAEEDEALVEPEEGASTTGPPPVRPYYNRTFTKRPPFIYVPSHYVYCTSYTTSRCKPKSLHDYCTWSPNSNKFGYGPAPARSQKRVTVSFRGPCARHDLMIGRISKWSTTLKAKRDRRAVGDIDFKNDIRQNCANKLWGKEKRDARGRCYSLASSYYTVVSTKTKYWNG